MQIEFHFCLSNLDDFIYFPCLIALARTSNMNFNKSGESGHLCLIPDVRRKLLALYH